MRPLLKPALRRVWRDEVTLQIGLDPERALVIAGVDPPAARFVETLDGTRDLAAALAGAGAVGIGEQRARFLLDLLGRSDVLDDATPGARPLATLSPQDREQLEPDLAALSLTCPGPQAGVLALARRGHACVLVVGAGRVGASVASLLAAAGVGRVLVEDPAPARLADVGPAGLLPESVGTSRQDAARSALRRRAPATRTDPPEDRGPDVAVLAPVGELDPDLPARLLRTGVPHLPLAVRETLGVVGPFVLPGRSSCLRCAHLRRVDRDPAWPSLAAQLVYGRPAPSPACEVSLATLVAAQGAMEVLALLDGSARPATVDGTLETRLPAGVTRRRTWGSHPACGCRWRQ